MVRALDGLRELKERAIMPKSQIAQRVAQIKNKIARKSLSQRELATLSGLPYTTLAHINKDEWNPTLQTLKRLEAALFPGKE